MNYRKENNGIVETEILAACAHHCVRANSLEDAVALCLPVLRSYLRWPVAHAFFRPSGSGAPFVTGNIWDIDGPFLFEHVKQVTSDALYHDENGLIGRTAARRKSECVRVSDGEPACSRTAAFKQDGVECVLAVPVETGEDVAAVLEFMNVSPEELPAFRFQQLETVAGLLGSVAVRAETRASSDMSRERTLAMLEGLTPKDRRLGEREAALVKLAEQLTHANRELESRVLLRTEEYRKATEEAEIANRSKTEFLANMSHELRTPLIGIIGFAEVIEKEIFGPIENDVYAEYVRDIQNSGRHLLALISDILDVSRLEAGRIKLDNEEVDVARIVPECIRMVGERAQRANVRIVTHLGAGSISVLGDVLRLKQILINLLANAVKFSSMHGVVRVEGVRLKDGQTRITVRDSGVGISKTDLPIVMKMFGQARRGHTHTHEGVGIGLALARRLAELHGGILEIESEPGRGTDVMLTLPAWRGVIPSADQQSAS